MVANVVPLKSSGIVSRSAGDTQNLGYWSVQFVTTSETSERVKLPAGRKKSLSLTNPWEGISMLSRLLKHLLVLCFASFCCAEDTFPVPEGFVLQPLDPTNGMIARPKNWYYMSEGTPDGWLWTLSAEDPTKGRYETGLRMQMIIGAEKALKVPRLMFAKQFIESKRMSTSVVRECPEVDAGMFTRQCLEVIEQIRRDNVMESYRIIYSVFWGKKIDLVVVSTFGARQEKWEEVKSISEAMSTVILIGKELGGKPASTE